MSQNNERRADMRPWGRGLWGRRSPQTRPRDGRAEDVTAADAPARTAAAQEGGGSGVPRRGCGRERAAANEAAREGEE